MKPEELARQDIDNLLTKAGWEVQDYRKINLGSSFGVAVREFPMKSGPADYLLFVDRTPVGVVEAKPQGTTLSGVADQSEKYIVEEAIPDNLPDVEGPLPFAYESTGVETFFRNTRDPEPRSRRVLAFHKPETLKEWFNELETLRARTDAFPELEMGTLRQCQFDAITSLEQSLAEDKPRALIQMATGSGKTYTAVSTSYRLLKHAKAKRILFLVDRGNLGRQTYKEFQQFVTPDDGRKFTELYNVQHLRSNTLDDVSKVTITTIQRLYSMLKGEPEIDPDLEEESIFEKPIQTTYEEQPPIEYNPRIPIETFDFIITDECHRSIYNLWRQVLEYFDAYLIGLTATPSKQTLGFFNKNLVMEYPYERAVADGVNVGYDVYQIKTKISSQGGKVDAGFYVDKRDKDTREVRWEQLDESLEYEARELDRDVVAKDQIRTVIRTYKDKLPEIFPGRDEVPKTLIYAKSDSHAEDIVQIAREEFGKGNDFCKKITYRTHRETGEKAEDLLQSFRNSYNPRIAVTVDMIATGTDIKPLECIVFMRDVKSRIYFEQMKGRGTRTISDTDLRSVTPDAAHKTHFVIVDAVGVTENDKTDSRPFERKRSVSFDNLVKNVALGNRDDDTMSSLAGRLSRLDQSINKEDKEEIEKITDGLTLKKIVNQIFDALDPDKVIDAAKNIAGTETPSEEDITKAEDQLKRKATTPFDNPELREFLSDAKRKNEQVIDTVSVDEVIHAGAVEQVDEAQETVQNFQQFIEKHKDEITALQILYNVPYKQRHLSYELIKELAKELSKEGINTNLVWQAYGVLDKSKVKGKRPEEQLTNIISLVRFALGRNDVLEPFPATVESNFDQWLEMQKKNGRTFTKEQIEWLGMIKDHIATSASMQMDAFDLTPFIEHGGAYKADDLFGDDLTVIIEDLNTYLIEKGNNI